jgi:hypothetical protein
LRVQSDFRYKRSESFDLKKRNLFLEWLALKFSEMVDKFFVVRIKVINYLLKSYFDTFRDLPTGLLRIGFILIKIIYFYIYLKRTLNF